jgi:tetratricopeptide (TPR) repeat protein
VSTYSLLDAASILKVSPARLRHWKRTTLAYSDIQTDAAPDVRLGKDDVAAGDQPLVDDPTAQKALLQSDFDFRDLVCVRAMLTLVDRGISVRRIGRAIAVLQENLPDLEDPLAALRLWGDEGGRIVVEHDGVLIEPEGQMVLDFSGEGAKENHPAPIAKPASKEATQPYEEVMSLFEHGCQLDSDPTTYNDAMVAYRKCIELDPTFADAHCNLGAVLYNGGKSAPARRCFERCLELDSRHVQAHFNLANLLEEEGCDEMAMSHYRQALRSDPFYAELHVNMALLCEKLQSSSSGRDHWRRYLQLDPAGTWSEVARQRLEADKPPKRTR